MSRSVLSCKSCHTPVAVKHHSGRIAVLAEVRVVILATGVVELRCTCGRTRLVRVGRIAEPCSSIYDGYTGRAADSERCS